MIINWFYFVPVDPLSGQLLGRRELRLRDLSVPAPVKSKSFTIIYDDEPGSSPPVAYIIVIFSKAISWRKPHAALVKRQIVEILLCFCQSWFIISCLLSHFMFKDKEEKSGQKVKRKISKLMNMIHSEAVDVIWRAQPGFSVCKYFRLLQLFSLYLHSNG